MTLLSACTSKPKPVSIQASAAQPKPFPTELWVPDDGSFSINIPKKPRTSPVGAGSTLYIFDSPELHGGPLVQVQVQVKNPYQQNIYTTDAFYDIYDRAYRGEPGAIVNTTEINNNGYRGRQFEITAGPHAPHIARLFSTDHRNYFVDWNPSVPHATQIADTFLMPQGATQP